MSRKQHSFSWMEHQHCGIVLSECYLKLCEFERTLYEAYAPASSRNLLGQKVAADTALQAASQVRQDLEELIRSMQDLLAQDFPRARSLVKALPYRTENRLLPQVSPLPPMKKKNSGRDSGSGPEPDSSL